MDLFFYIRLNDVKQFLQTNTSANGFGVNIDIFKGYAYLFLDNGTPAEPGKPFSVQEMSDWVALKELLDIIKPYIKK